MPAKSSRSKKRRSEPEIVVISDEEAPEPVLDKDVVQEPVLDEDVVQDQPVDEDVVQLGPILEEGPAARYRRLTRKQLEKLCFKTETRLEEAEQNARLDRYAATSGSRVLHEQDQAKLKKKQEKLEQTEAVLVQTQAKLADLQGRHVELKESYASFSTTVESLLPALNKMKSGMSARSQQFLEDLPEEFKKLRADLDRF